MIARMALLGAMAALLTGCASTTRQDGSLATASDRSLSGSVLTNLNPALTFATPEMMRHLSRRGLAPGFGRDDWEYGRNDSRLPVGGIGPAANEFSAYDIEQHDRQTSSGGRPRDNTRTTVRSRRSGGW